MSSNLEIVIKATDRASGDINKVKNSLGGLNSTGGLAGKTLGGLAGVLSGALELGATAALAGLTALGVGIGKSVMAAADFEQQMADIAAVMGKSTEELGPLKELIQNLGFDPQLKVSAVEAADAVEMLVKNGVELDDIMAGAARSAILLANATNDDFALAADVATDAMLQFNISAEDMSKAVDGIIGVTQASKFDINDYALAIGQAGGVAGSVGVDFDDFNAAIAATSSSFASGSDAGTSFKVFLQNLVPDTNKSADAMRDLGLFSGLSAGEFDKLQGKISDTEQKIAALDPTSKNYAEQLDKLTLKLSQQRSELVAGNSAFFDANGNMKSMEDIAGALQTAFGGLSDAERIQTASTIFGTDAMRTALALAEGGRETIVKYKEVIGNTSAEDAAATRMDTLKGKWEIFQGQVEGLSIAIGEKFLPVSERVVTWASSMAEKYGPDLIKTAEDIATKFSTLIDALLAGDEGATWDALEKIWGKDLPVSIDELRDTWETFGTSYDKVSKEVQETLAVLKHRWRNDYDEMEDTSDNFWENVIGGTRADMENLASILTIAMNLIQLDWKAAWAELQAWNKKSAEETPEPWIEMFPLLDNIMYAGGTDSAESMLQAMEDKRADGELRMQVWGRGLTDALAAVMNWGSIGTNAVQGFIDGISSKIGEAQAKIGELGALVTDILNLELETQSPSKATYRIGRYSTEGLLLGMQSNATSLTNWLNQLAESVTGSLQAIQNFVNSSVASLGGTIQQGISSAGVGTSAAQAATATTSTSTAAEEMAIYGYVKGSVDDPYVWAPRFDEILGAWMEQYAHLMDPTMGDELADAVEFGLNRQLGDIVNSLSLAALDKGVYQDLYPVIEHVINFGELTSGSEFGQSEGTYQIVNDLMQGVIESVKDTLGIHSRSKVFEYLGKMSGEGFIAGLAASMGSAMDIMKDGASAAAGGTGQYMTPLPATTNNFNIYLQGSGQAGQDVQNTVATLQMMYATP